MLFAISLPLLLALAGSWFSYKLCIRVIRRSVNFLEQAMLCEFRWEDALKYEPTDLQWGQLRLIAQQSLPAIPELVQLSADLQWAIMMRNLIGAREALEELEKKMYLLNLHNYEAFEKLTTLGPGTPDWDWHC